MTPTEILATIKEYQTTDSISKKDTLFSLIRQKSWEVWFTGYQCARKLYLEYPLPTVVNLLKRWGPVDRDINKSANGYFYYTQIDTHSPAYQHHIFDDQIILSGLTEEGINIGLPASITVKFRMFNPDYLDFCIREIKPFLHYQLSCEIYNKQQELKQLEKSVQIDPCRRENVTLFVEIRLTLGDEIKMTPVGILRKGFFCSFRNPSPGTAGVNLKLQIYDYKIKKYPSMLPVGDGIKGNGRGFPYIP